MPPFSVNDGGKRESRSAPLRRARAYSKPARVWRACTDTLFAAGQWPSNLLDAAGIAGHGAGLPRGSSFGSALSSVSRSLLLLLCSVTFPKVKRTQGARQTLARSLSSYANANANWRRRPRVPAGRLTFFPSSLLPLLHKSSSRGTATFFRAAFFCRAGDERCTRRESLRSMIARETAATAASCKVATAANFTRGSHSRRPGNPRVGEPLVSRRGITSPMGGERERESARKVSRSRAPTQGDGPAARDERDRRERRGSFPPSVPRRRRATASRLRSGRAIRKS